MSKEQHCNYPGSDAYYDRVVALKERLEKLVESEDAPEWQDHTPEPVKTYELNLGFDVTTSYGGVHVEVVPHDDSIMSTMFRFEVELGPVNAAKLIDFLKTLPAEPDDEVSP